MIKTGKSIITRISRARIKEVQEAGLNIIIKENAAIVMFTPNMQWTSKAFSDIRFRKALNLAIDKQAIIKHIFAGKAKPYANYPGRNGFTCGADPSLKPYAYNPEEAKRLIKEGGYEGHEFTVPTYKRSGCPEFPQVVEALAGYWQQVGLKPKIFVTDYASWRKRRNAEKIQNTVHGYDGTSNAGCADLKRRNHKRYFSKSKWALVHDTYLDDRLEKIAVSLDPAEVEKLMGDVYRYGYEQYFNIPICEIPDVIATTKGIPAWNPGMRRMDRNTQYLIREQ